MTKKKEIPPFKKKVITYEFDWSKIPIGSKFIGNRKGKKIFGRIQKQGTTIYLCQNTIDGSTIDNRLGYKYSWQIQNGTLANIKENGLIDLKITLDPDYIIPETIKVAGRLVTFQKGYITVGCSTIKNKDVINIMANLID